MYTNERRVLNIPDLHAPFTLEGFLEHCKRVYDYYACTDVVFLGDVVDNHFSSYHSTDPDGMGAREELEQGKAILQDWYRMFPDATVILGNHDRIFDRKVFTAGLSASVLKPIEKILEVPNWNFVESFTLDGVHYTHGIGQSVLSRMKDEGLSVVQGHHHSKTGIEWLINEHQYTFGMQLGCGIDREAYAFAYGKDFKRPVINCGVVLGNGNVPIIEYMR